MRLQDHCSTLLTTLKFIHLHSSIRTFFERVFQKIFWTLLGYTVAKAPASSRNLTWFTRPLLLVRGWGLGTRLGPQLVHFLSHMTDHEVKHGNHQAYFMQKVIKEWTGNKFTVLSPVPSPSTNTTFHSTQEQGNTMEPYLTNTPQQQTHTIKQTILRVSTVLPFTPILKQPLNSGYPATLYNGQFSRSQLYANTT